MSSSMEARLVGNTFSPSMTSWSDWISASGDTVLIRKPSAPPPMAARSTSTDRSSASTTIRAVGNASRRARRSASSLTGLAADHQVRRSGSLSGGQGQVDRVEFSAHFKAGTGQQMLQSFAEKAVGFDQDGAGRGHGGLPPKALMIERPRDPGWSAVARSRLRWRDTARKIAGNKDKINTLSRVNGSMRAVRFTEREPPPSDIGWQPAHSLR